MVLILSSSEHENVRRFLFSSRADNLTSNLNKVVIWEIEILRGVSYAVFMFLA